MVEVLGYILVAVNPSPQEMLEALQLTITEAT